MFNASILENTDFIKYYENRTGILISKESYIGKWELTKRCIVNPYLCIDRQVKVFQILQVKLSAMHEKYQATKY
ncbi:MAG: hypothetical protein WC748_09905 [Legionellales bacterium]|jgi:hypothetical protein